MAERIGHKSSRQSRREMSEAEAGLRIMKRENNTLIRSYIDLS